MMAKQEWNKHRELENLHERYGKIGISAVAAALVFQGDGKNPAYAPITPRYDQRYAEAA
jgi:hypothetical protein